MATSTTAPLPTVTISGTAVNVSGALNDTIQINSTTLPRPSFTFIGNTLEISATNVNITSSSQVAIGVSGTGPVDLTLGGAALGTAVKNAVVTDSLTPNARGAGLTIGDLGLGNTITGVNLRGAVVDLSPGQGYPTVADALKKVLPVKGGEMLNTANGGSFYWGQGSTAPSALNLGLMNPSI